MVLCDYRALSSAVWLTPSLLMRSSRQGSRRDTSRAPGMFAFLFYHCFTLLMFIMSPIYRTRSFTVSSGPVFVTLNFPAISEPRNPTFSTALLKPFQTTTITVSPIRSQAISSLLYYSKNPYGGRKCQFTVCQDPIAS